MSAFKPQIDYIAEHCTKGQLKRLMAHMRPVAPQFPVFLDAKRGGINHTAGQYAIEAFEAFERHGVDALTLSPFMGFDLFAHYLKYHGKSAFLLYRTTNSSRAMIYAFRDAVLVVASRRVALKARDVLKAVRN